MTRISKLLAGGGAAQNPVLQQAFATVAASGGRLHLLGLVSDGGVHSHQAHLEALLAHCRERGVRPVVHAFLDGRDTPPRSALGFLARAAPARRGRGRPRRHGDRALLGDGPRPALGARAARLRRDRAGARARPRPSALAAVERRLRASDQTDEFVEPRVIDGRRAARRRRRRALLQLPRRPRAPAHRTRSPACARSASRASWCGGGCRSSRRSSASPSTTRRSGCPSRSRREMPTRILGELLAERGLAQLRMAETEKYAHVTFFFNGGCEEPFPGEERVLVPSPRDVADLRPQARDERLAGDARSCSQQHRRATTARSCW